MFPTGPLKHVWPLCSDVNTHCIKENISHVADSASFLFTLPSKNESSKNNPAGWNPAVDAVPLTRTREIHYNHRAET